MADIVTDLSINKAWNVAVGFNNTFTFTFTLSGAFNISTYTFSLQIRKYNDSTNVVNLTQGFGLTNGGSNGILTAVLNAANSALLTDGEYFWQLTVVHPDTFSYRWFNGPLRAYKELYSGDTASSVAATISLTGGNVTATMTLPGADVDAIHDNVSGEISAITEKTSLVNDDLFIIEDSAASNAKKKVKKSNFGFAPKVIAIACSDETTALTAGTGKVTFRMPYAMTLTAVRASLTTAQTSGSIFTVDINEGGTTILSTKITIDNTEKTSTAATTAPVISDTALADDAEITIDIDQIGDGTAKGLKVYLIG